jgi:hypothetical protein
MTTRLNQIILRARDTLGDPDGERWSTARLLRLASEGQQDIAKQTKILKAQLDVPVVQGQAEYTLPNDVWELTRVTFNDVKIPFVSFSNIFDLLLQ